MRLFDEHIKRKVISLDGGWKFRADKANVGESEGWYNKIPEAMTVTVPHAFSTELELLSYEGVAWYEKYFYTSGETIKLSFEAVMTEAKVYFDGKLLGSHYGGFCEFSFTVTDVCPGYHRVTVAVDNRFDDNSIPQRTVDWFHDGGITRSVSVMELRGITVSSYKLDYKIVGDVADCKLSLELYCAEEGEDTVEVSLDGKQAAKKAVKMKKGEKESIELAFTVDRVRLWDVGAPELYSININTKSDDLIDRVGFRTVEVKDGALLLNGSPVEIRGINRHESHPDFGFAVPATIMKRDLDILERMGANAIRGSHYPNSRIFLDMLDERGVLFYSEIPIWGVGFSVEALGDPAVVERGLEMHREMIKYYYNHPSIIIWGMHNEIRAYTEEAYEMTKKYHAYLKENGGNRIITYAVNNAMTDICLEFCDIICINEYIGWYGGEIDGWKSFLEKFKRRVEELGVADKPIVFSEFGAAAIYGYHTFDDIRWTEEYQARLMRHCIELFHSDDRVIGFFPWQMCDGRTSQEMGLNRARGYNNKGVLSEYRRPKMAYNTLSELYNKYKNS